MRLIHLSRRVGQGLEIEEEGREPFDPQADYDYAVDEEGDLDALDALIKQDSTLVVNLAISSARFLAEGMEALAEAVARPYTLRTTADVPIIVEALQQQLEAAAGVAAGLAGWLRAAHERGEAGDPASLVAQLTTLADQIHQVAAQTQVDTVPEDRSPAMEPPAVAERVTAELQRRGVPVGKTVISHCGINWELADGLVLSVNEDDWELLAATEEGGIYREVFEVRLPIQAFAHPAQVADIVADWFTQRN